MRSWRYLPVTQDVTVKSTTDKSILILNRDNADISSCTLVIDPYLM